MEFTGVQVLCYPDIIYPVSDPRSLLKYLLYNTPLCHIRSLLPLGLVHVMIQYFTPHVYPLEGDSQKVPRIK